MTENRFDWENASLEKSLRRAIEDTTKSLRTAFPAKVVSFDPLNQTAVIACQIHTVLHPSDQVQALPPLEDVPVQFPRSGGFAITFPLQAGDEGIAIIADRCIDGWWSTGDASQPMRLRSHDLSDAMFIPGITSVINATQGFDSDALAIRSQDGTQSIKLFQNGNIELDGKQLIVKCPTVFEALLSFQNGISGISGEHGNALEGDLRVINGDLTADNISTKYHFHTDSIGGKTSEARG